MSEIYICHIVINTASAQSGGGGSQTRPCQYRISMFLFEFCNKILRLISYLLLPGEYRRGDSESDELEKLGFK